MSLGQESTTATDAATESALHECEARLRGLIDLLPDYYWEQDEDGRFTVIQYRNATERKRIAAQLIGKTRWEAGGAPETGTWEDHKATLRARAPFDDFVTRRIELDGSERYFTSNGRPVFAADGRFCGYRGIARDITSERRNARLQRLDHAVTAILASARDVKGALVAALRAICESEGWAAGQYWSLDEAKHIMRFDVGWRASGEVSAALADDATFERGKGLVGSVWEAAQPLWVPDMCAEPRVLRKDIPKRTGWNSALLCPVFANTKTIGVLDFNAAKIPKPDARLLQIVKLLGMQIGNFYERALAMAELRESEERYSSTVELAAIGITHVATDGHFVHVNRQFCEMIGYTKEELLALTAKDVSHPDDATLTDHDRARLHAGEIDSLRVEKRYIRKDGSTIWVRITAAIKRGADGAPLYDISIIEDISDRKRAEERVRYLASYDDMTGLPNRATFGEMLHHTIESARRHSRLCAVLFIDLDRFKVINDSLGHDAGDALLKEISSRLVRRVRTSDVVARLGGDEFVVLLEELARPEDAAEVARKILSAVLEPIEIDGQECRVTASIGIATYPADAGDAATLMRHADVAMYHAKEEGKNNYQYYTKEISPMSVEELALETHLRRALEQNEFSLQYQAKVDLRSGAVTGVEALLRWWNHQLGKVSPSQFIPIAEETGLIVSIGRWVLETACAQNVAWQRQGLPSLVMCVNLSARQFRDSRLLQDITDVLESTGITPELLELEITESMLMTNLEQAIAKAEAIKRLGVRLAIDDFGTGYSSLSHLKRFPIDTLKVDRSFIRDLPANNEDKAITDAIIAMGKTLGVTVVAEGVETAAQQAFLAGHGCDEMQGFFFSKPCHPDAVAELLTGRSGGRAVGEE
jgi:diguanylate cyclase (GGDEF)-like protein/PAS domain S-box-containing protein